MELGYRLLAEAFIRERRLDEALKALNKLPESRGKMTLSRELRNNSIKEGRYDLFSKASEIIGLRADDPGDLINILFVNVKKGNVSAAVEIFNMLPESDLKADLAKTVIITLAHQGSILGCERIAMNCNAQLSKDQALIAKRTAIREGWISDAERAAEIAKVDITKEDYLIMMIANKDKGLLFDAQEAAKRAGEEIDEVSLITLLLAGVRYNRESVWDIAEMI